MILVAGFEAICALHLAVERFGRYLQVFHEQDEGGEHVVFLYRRRVPSGPDPLFGRIFMLATSVNFIPVALGGDVPEIVVLAVSICSSLIASGWRALPLPVSVPKTSIDSPL